MPSLDSDVLINCSGKMYQVYAQKLLADKVNSATFKIQAKENIGQNNKTVNEWIYNKPIYNFNFTNNFILNHYGINSQQYLLFLDTFKLFIQPFLKLDSRSEIKRVRPLAIFVCSYKTNRNQTFKFILDTDSNADVFLESFIEVFNSIKYYTQKGKNEFKSTIAKTYSQPDKIKYFIFSNEKWNVLDPLLEIVNEINLEYRKNKDVRAKKPLIILNKDNLRQKLVFDSNWILKFDNLETLLIKPNDVSIYSNISDRNLEKSKEFFEKTILPRHKNYLGLFPHIEEQKKYFDYFELIISSVIFAYTALEAFANICIPEDYEFVVEKDEVKTIYSKRAIERRYSLRDKFKLILKSIFETSDPTKEKWWDEFIDLENLRDEVVHTKQAKSEDRYSQLLSKKIFRTISVHREIIKFYGYYISKNKKELLKEFPYDFGYDEFQPALMTKAHYEEGLRELHNIPKKKTKRNSKKI